MQWESENELGLAVDASSIDMGAVLNDRRTVQATLLLF